VYNNPVERSEREHTLADYMASMLKQTKLLEPINCQKVSFDSLQVKLHPGDYVLVSGDSAQPLEGTEVGRPVSSATDHPNSGQDS